jgi:uncharacterized protein YndB with AHSA1/START domain
MSKQKFHDEYEIRASNKMLYPYLTSPAGLAQWFADQVNLDENKVFNFMWDNRAHYARLTAQRMNRYVRFEFLSDTKSDEEDPAYIEFRLDMNELTQSSFLKVTDYSEVNSDDLKELWAHLVSNLRETVGG